MPLVYLGSLPRRIRKSEILAFLNQVGGLDRGRVGRIDLQSGSAAIEVPEGWPTRLAKALDGQTLGERPVRAWAESAPDSGLDADDHFVRLTRLLELESQAEASQASERSRRLSRADAERTGMSLIDMVVIDEEAGLGGRFLLTLAKRKRSPLPWTRLGVGSPVVLTPDTNQDGRNYQGVVSDRDEKGIQIAFGSLPDDLSEQEAWRLDLSNPEASVQRQRAALHQVSAARGDRLAELRAVLLGECQGEYSAKQDDLVFESGLNETQQAAVQFALSADDLALIHGPPGTGKTTTVVELIRQVVQKEQKVLACAPSNMAVDNIFERLLAAGVNAVRLGHPARVMPGLREHTLDLLVAEHPDVRLARKLVKEAMGLFRKAGRYTRAKPEPGARREARQEAKSLLADARRLEARAVEHILDQADVLCATTTSLNSAVLGTRRFDLAVIDEACQSTEPGCWIPLLRCDRLVLAGDHCQLPPTVISREAAAGGFGLSLFERLMAEHGSEIARRLSVQYRMHESIMDFSSLEFYEAELEADSVVSQHVLAGLSDVSETPLTTSPVDFIDTAGASYDEEIEADGESRLNRQEAALVCLKVRELLDAGVSAVDIAVIAPYAAQARLLRELLPVTGLEIDSVDGFQGREKEAVVISLVRSNPQAEIGFLSDVRRMNVALTRARRKLIVIGDSATLSGDAFYLRMIEYFESIGAYRTVWEEDVL